MRISSSRIFSGVALFLTSIPTFALSETVTIGTVQTYNPTNYTVKADTLRGFETALANDLCQRAEVTCEWKVLPAEKLWSALDAKDIDIVMAGIPMDIEIDDTVTLTMAYLALDPYVHIGLPGTRWAIESAQVAHLPDPAVTTYAKTTGATFSEYETLDDALAALKAGKVLSCFGEREVFTPLVEASGGDLIVIPGKEGVKIKPGIAMAMRADDVDLRFAFEDQIDAMIQDGSLDTLTRKWFGMDASGLR